MLLDSLPHDPETPERFRIFSQRLAAAPQAEAVEFYEALARGDIAISSVHDAVMVVEALRAAPELIPIVGGAVEQFLRRRLVRGSLADSWSSIKAASKKMGGQAA